MTVLMTAESRQFILQRNPAVKKLSAPLRTTPAVWIKKLYHRFSNPFFTTKPIGSGTGLGMSIAYDAMKQNNGTISVDSEPGKGTKFTLTLPIPEQ